LRRADTDDRAGNRMRGGHWNAEPRRGEQRDRPARLGAKTAYRLQLGDLLAHRADNPPTAEQRADTHRQIAATDHPQRRCVRDRRGIAGRDQQHPDDADGLLRIVTAVAEAIQTCGDKLQTPETPVDLARWRAEIDPRDR